MPRGSAAVKPPVVKRRRRKRERMVVASAPPPAPVPPAAPGVRPGDPVPTEGIDEPVRLLVAGMNLSPEVSTLSSCSGHGEVWAMVDLAVRADAMLAFVARLGRVADKLRADVRIQVKLVWEGPLVAALAAFPEWIPLAMTIETYGARPPSPDVIELVSRAWRADVRRTAKGAT